VFTVPPTLQSFGEVVAQEFERPESRALPTFVSVEAGNATPKTAFRSLELAVPTQLGHSLVEKAASRASNERCPFSRFGSTRPACPTSHRTVRTPGDRSSCVNVPALQ